MSEDVNGSGSDRRSMLLCSVFYADNKLEREEVIMADIVIYGGSFAAAAAASKAAAQAPNKQVVVIIPNPVTASDPNRSFGSIGTIGGQNFFDTCRWNGRYVTGGSFSWWIKKCGKFYNTDDMSKQLCSDVTKYTNINVYYGYDIKSFSAASSPYRITQVTVCSIYRNTSGTVVWGNNTATITGAVFVDASDDGRLARIANPACTVGRYDWPAQYLDDSEKGPNGRALQQAATLMFKVQGVKYPANLSGTPFTIRDGVVGYAGGTETYQKNSDVISFNKNHAQQGYAIKPINAAQNGKVPDNVKPEDWEWWVNCLLVFNVDGRAYDRDIGTSFYPTDKRDDYKTVDQAWKDARKVIAETSFLNALHAFEGFECATLVKDNYGNPVVGTVMYLRETIHMSKNSANRANGTENTNYQLTVKECIAAGPNKNEGEDKGNYDTRIGLNYYNMDINAYQVSDLLSGGAYIWGADITKKLRPDLATSGNLSGNLPYNPVYVPYNALTTSYVANLLIPGYAAGISSCGWAECRVIPNLCVLGDAAGVAAAYAVNNGKYPLRFTSEDILAVQTTLRSCGACLDK